MPKRTNDFQSLVALIEAQLADEKAHVTESKMVVDGRTGEEREVDIHIAQAAGWHAVRLAVECIDHGRPATVEWIDRMIGKYRDLPIDKLIAVSRSGFTKTAREKAEAARIETLTLQQAAAVDWAQVLNRGKRLRVSRLQLRDVRIGMLVKPDSSKALEEGDVTERLITNSDGSNGRTIAAETSGLLSDSDLQEKINRELDKFRPTLRESGETCAVSVQLYYEEGVSITAAQGDRHELKALQLVLIFEYTPTRIPLELKGYGDSLVASASFDLDESRITYAIVESPGRDVKHGVSVRPKHPGAATLTPIVGPMGHVDFLLPSRSSRDTPGG